MFLLGEGLAVVVIALFNIIRVNFFLFCGQLLQANFEGWVVRELSLFEKIILCLSLF